MEDLEDPFVLITIDRWKDLQQTFLEHWPSGAPAYYVLETKRLWKEKGLEKAFKVYCPFGHICNGFLGMNIKKFRKHYELILHCPATDTASLEEALKETKIIDWDQEVRFPFVSFHLRDSLEKVAQLKNLELTHRLFSSYSLNKDKGIFENVSLLPGFTFKLLTLEYLELIDTKWPYHHPSSHEYFNQMIQSNSGYGLFQKDFLISWVLVGEYGTLTHLYTLEEHRGKGYGELMLKYITNILLKENKEVYFFCLKTNTQVMRLYEKVGFERTHDVISCYLKKALKTTKLDEK